MYEESLGTMSNVIHEQPMIDQPMVIPETDIAQEQSLLNRIHDLGAKVTEFASAQFDRLSDIKMPRKLTAGIAAGSLALGGAAAEQAIHPEESHAAGAGLEIIYTNYIPTDTPKEKRAAMKELKKQWHKDCKKSPDDFHMSLIGPSKDDILEGMEEAGNNGVTYEIPEANLTVASMSCKKVGKVSLSVWNGGYYDKLFAKWRDTYNKPSKLHTHEIQIQNVGVWLNAKKGLRTLYYDQAI